MNTRLRRLLAPLGLALCLAVLAACGPSNKLTITATDFHFSPENVTVAAGETITVTFVNKGSIRHEWVIVKQGESITLPFDEDDALKVVWEIRADPGQTVTDSFAAPSEPGRYEVICNVLGHLELGMTGSLNVQ